MNQTRNVNLPIVGRIQHGEQVTANGITRAKELGHFIAKIQDDFMQAFLQKFNQIYKGKKYIEIEFYDDNPLSKKFVRYNQSGDVCHCIEGQNTGSQKTKNGWQPIECNTEQCQYRQKNEYGKTACNRIGWLKFLIPDVCQDRIWLMRITGQTSINAIDDYIQVQKALGNPLKGRYVLFLKQKEQTSKATGQTFNNYVLDILKKEDFLSEQIPPQKTEKPNELSTTNVQNVNNYTDKQEKPTAKIETVTTNANDNQTEDKKAKEKTTKKSTTTKDTTKKETKTKTKKTEEKQPEEKQTETTSENSNNPNEYDNYYVLYSTYTDKIKDKNGIEKEYLIGKFYSFQDKEFNIAVRPEHAQELLECDIGTIVELEIKDVLDRKFAVNLKFIEKRTKKVAA